MAALLVAVTTLCLRASRACAAEVQDQDGSRTQYFSYLSPSGGAYRFGYDTGAFGHQSFREETRTEQGSVRGQYGYVESGVLRITEYTADHLGYRCRETVRYLVKPDRGLFPSSSPLRALGSRRLFRTSPKPLRGQETGWRNGIAQLQDRRESAGERVRWEPAKPARVMGRKVVGRYKDFTNEPAVGGTAAVSRWDSAHGAAAELREEEVLGMGSVPV